MDLLRQTYVEGAAVQLQASNSYDLRIGVFDESEFAFSIDLVDDLGNMVAQYVSAEELDAHVAASDNLLIGSPIKISSMPWAGFLVRVKRP